FFFFQAEDGIRDFHVTGVQTCALPIFRKLFGMGRASRGKTESDRIGFHPGTGAERARRPGPGMPTDRRCDDRDAPAPGDLRRNPRTGQQRTAKAVLPSNRPPGLPSETLFRQGLVCGVLRRRKVRSEEHTSELQSREKLVCRLLLEKKK